MQDMPTLFPYQMDVTNRARHRMSEGCRRVIVQGATGGGKGMVIAFMAKLGFDRGKSVLILNDRRDIVSELSRRLDLFQVPHGILMNGVRRSDATVQIASRDTLASRTLRNDWLRLPTSDLVILDECHRSMGDVYQMLLSKYPASYVCGFSATPATDNGRGLGSYWQALECMVPTSQLIREGRLVPVRCYAPERMVKGKVKSKGLRGDPVAQWLKLANGRPTVSFTTKKEQSRALVARFQKAGVPAEHLDAFTSDEEREEIKERLRTGKTLIASNCGVWKEGTDIPELSCCILLRACAFKVVYLQMVGRIMRSHPGKREAVLIDHAGAVLRHGLPSDDVEWTLDEEDTVDARLAKSRKEGKVAKPIVCPRCAIIFSGTGTCPHCGYVLRPKQTYISTMNEILVEVPAGKRAAAVADHRLKLWKKCLGIAAARGTTVGAAAAHFTRESGGSAPWVLGIPNLPEPGSADWQRRVTEVYPQYERRVFR